MIEIRQLASDDMGLIAGIDRSEHMDVQFAVSDGRLTARRVSIDVPAWDLVGSGPHSVERFVEFWQPIVAAGAGFFGAFAADELVGLAVVDGSFEPDTAWLGALYVSRPYRRTGVATALWAEAERVAREAAAGSMYVSATPSGSAVGFYLSRGCVLAGSSTHPELHRLEPDDIHLICPIPPKSS